MTTARRFYIEALSNTNHANNRDAEELLNWWCESRARLKLRLKEIRQDHYDKCNFQIGLCYRVGKHVEEFFDRNGNADAVRTNRRIAFSGLGEYLNKSGRPNVRNAVGIYRRAMRGARNISMRFGENDTEYYSACGHDDYLSECREELLKEARAAIRLARMFKDQELEREL